MWIYFGIGIAILALALTLIRPICVSIRSKRIVKHLAYIKSVHGFNDSLGVVSLNNKYVISVDKDTRKWCYYNAVSKKGTIYNFNDLHSYTIYENKETEVDGKTGEVIAGGILFGIFGMFVAASGSRKISDYCTNINLSLRFANGEVLSFDIYKGKINKNKSQYKNSILANAKIFADVLDYIINNRSDKNITQS